MSTDDTTRDDSLSTQVFDPHPVQDAVPREPSDEDSTEPGTEPGPAPAPAPGTGSSPSTGPTAPPERPYLRGPAPFAIVLGLLGLLVAAAVLVGELSDLTVNWDNLGPWTVVAAGVVVLVVGTLGVRASRPRD